MKKIKRLLVFVLTLSMILTLFSGFVLAGEEPADENGIIVAGEAALTEETETAAPAAGEHAEEGVIPEGSALPEGPAAGQEEEAGDVSLEEALPEGVLEITESDSAAADLGGDSDELLTDYIEVSLGTSTKAAYSVMGAGKSLSGAERYIYDYLKTKIKEVAAGREQTTRFEITNISEIGMDEFSWPSETNTIPAETLPSIKRQIDLSKLNVALLFDIPYDLYWYDKTIGIKQDMGFISATSGQGYQITLTKLTFSLIVSEDYANKDGKVYYDRKVYDNKTIMPDGDYIQTNGKPSVVDSALEMIGFIVEEHASSGDYDKLLAYKDKICSEVSYNNAANSNPNTPYGDPWQLIWVFDGDPATNVVCEGYSKAFQYLVDLSTFRDSRVKSRMVTGNMKGGTGEGDHMWNIVTMNDGKNYLVDVTNSDAGSVGQDGSLFLAGGNGNEETGYQCSVRSGTIQYVYDKETKQLYPSSDIAIGDEAYDPSFVPDIPERIEYRIEGDFHLMPGTGEDIRKEYEVRVQNQEHPDGAELTYEVTDVAVVEDPDHILRQGVQKVYEEEDPSGENYRWHFDLDEKASGTAVLEITYQDLEGKDQSYRISVYAVDDTYEVRMIGQDGRELALPGQPFRVGAMVTHRHFDRETGEIRRTDLSGMDYLWTVDSGAKWTELTPDAEDSAILPTETGMFDTCTTVPLRKPSGDEPIDREEICVKLTVLDQGTKAAEEIFRIRVTSEYYDLFPTFVEYNTRPGETITIAPEIRHYTYGSEGYQTVSGVSFEIDSFDPAQVEVKADDEGGFTVKRISDDRIGFRLKASWIEGEDPYTADRSYEFGPIEQKPWIKGDLNEDGDVTAADLTILAKHIARIALITEEHLLKAADVNGDGDITSADLTHLAKYIAKIIQEL